MPPTTDHKLLLEYLDKEMTIMGLLSGFWVALVGLVFQAVGAAQADTLLRMHVAARQSPPMTCEFASSGCFGTTYVPLLQSHGATAERR
jgi:hypothetical protein